MRSWLTRRISLSREASGEGRSPSLFRRASTKRSIGFRGQPLSFTSGTGAPSTGINDQCGLNSAPSSIQRRMSAISSGLSDRLLQDGGIFTAGSAEVIRRTTSLLSGSPGLMTNMSPFKALRALSGRSSRSPASRVFASGPWQGKQRSESRGRTWKLKSIFSPGAASSRGSNWIRIDRAGIASLASHIAALRIED